MTTHRFETEKELKERKKKKEGAWRLTVYVNYGHGAKFGRRYLYDDEKAYQRQFDIHVKRTKETNNSIVHIVGEAFDGKVWAHLKQWIHPDPSQVC